MNQVFDRYLQAIGGADRLARLTSYAAKGTYSGFDTDRSTVPIELYAKSPAQQTVVVHLTIGASTRVFDGKNAWIAGPGSRSALTLTGGNLDRARLERLATFRRKLCHSNLQWRVADDSYDKTSSSSMLQPLPVRLFRQHGLLVRCCGSRPPVAFVRNNRYAESRAACVCEGSIYANMLNHMQDATATDIQRNARSTRRFPNAPAKRVGEVTKEEEIMESPDLVALVLGLPLQ